MEKQNMRFCIVPLLCLVSLLGGASADVGSLMSQDLFNQMLKHRNDAACPGKGFYTYDAFITAAKAFGSFGTTGDTDTQKREIAAFLAQTSYETSGGWQTSSDDPYAWGYCEVQEEDPSSDYCVATAPWPCESGKKYYGRGPFQISYNYNYGPAGKAIGVDLLANPDLVATDPVISFKTALWFWMNPLSHNISCHQAITGQWTPSAADIARGRAPGYGLVTNLINGGFECGGEINPREPDRIGFYTRYCDILGVGYGDNLNCYTAKPSGNVMLRLSLVCNSGF